MDESIVNKYIFKRHCAYARKVLVVEWILMGFLLSISYKSVLLANMMSVVYEKGINSIDDMINSKKPLLVIQSMEPLFVTDLRPNIIELSKQVQYFNFDKFKKVPQWVVNGYAFFICIKCMYHNFQLFFAIQLRTFLTNDFVILGVGTGNRHLDVGGLPTDWAGACKSVSMQLVE